MLVVSIAACAGGGTTDEPIETTPPPPPPLNLVEAQVTRVVDGDTIHVLVDGMEYRLRYIGIDTPETKHPTLGVEPFGPEATQANSELVEGKTVWLEKDVSETDRYGRLLRYVYVDDLMVNEELLRRGLAKVATFPPDVKYVDDFLEIQRTAQEAGTGMWGQVQSEALRSLASARISALVNEALGYTHQRPDGNRLVTGKGNLPDVRPLDISLDGKPQWLVAVPMDEGSLWVAVLAEKSAPIWRQLSHPTARWPSAWATRGTRYASGCRSHCRLMPGCLALEV
jgi:endonuclease YncB( thermonuclease family)